MKEISFSDDALEVVKRLTGSLLIFRNTQTVRYFIVSEVEVYRGEEDTACHCRNGKTPRSAVLYNPGGYIYVYLIYGMYYMLNIVTGKKNQPQAILFRGLQEIVFDGSSIKRHILYDGPGKLTKTLGIDKSINNKKLDDIDFLDILPVELPYKLSFCRQTNRIGIDYAEEPWKSIPWRFVFNVKDYEKIHSLAVYRSVLDAVCH